jgi:hypothetical protein
MGQRKDTLPGIGGLEAAYREARKSHKIPDEGNNFDRLSHRCARVHR